MNYGVSCGIWGNIFGVPKVIADNFLKLATGSQLKVIIYLLRNSDKKFSIEEIAEETGLSETEVSDSLIFWNQMNILKDSENIQQQSSIFSMPEDTKKSDDEKDRNYKYSSSGINLNPSDISEIIENSSYIRELFSSAEEKLAVMNFPVQRSLIFMHQYLGLPSDVIMTLINYCVSENIRGIYEMDSLAYSWSQNGIDTLKLAQAEVERLKENQKYKLFIIKIKRILERDGNLIPKQKKYIYKWKDEGYADELIECAYHRAMETTGNPQRLPIEYIDKILASWKSAGITTLEEAEKADIEFKNEYKPKKSDSGKASEEEKENMYSIFLNNF